MINSYLNQRNYPQQYPAQATRSLTAQQILQAGLSSIIGKGLVSSESSALDQSSLHEFLLSLDPAPLDKSSEADLLRVIDLTANKNLAIISKGNAIVVPAALNEDEYSQLLEIGTRMAYLKHGIKSFKM